MPTLDQIIDQLIAEHLGNILKEEEGEENNSGPLYHVTYFNRLQGIVGAGLRPRQARSIGSRAYDAHAKKGIFLTEEDGIDFWFTKAEQFAEHNSDSPLEDGLVPVVLRIDPQGFTEDMLTDDDLGSKDANNSAYVVADSIEPDYIDVWNGVGWVSIDEWESIDPEISFDKEEIEGEDGMPEEYYLFKYTNPLKPQ